jgi:hypothetical protein
MIPSSPILTKWFRFLGGATFAVGTSGRVYRFAK